MKGDLDKSLSDYNQALRLDPRSVVRAERTRRCPALQGSVRPGDRRLRPGITGSILDRWMRRCTVGDTPGSARKSTTRRLPDYNEALRLDPYNVMIDCYCLPRTGISRASSSRPLPTDDEADPVSYLVRCRGIRHRGGAWLKRTAYDKALADLNEAILTLIPKNAIFFPIVAPLGNRRKMTRPSPTRTKRSDSIPRTAWPISIVAEPGRSRAISTRRWLTSTRRRLRLDPNNFRGELRPRRSLAKEELLRQSHC